jgi:two-component system chemotaxis response regulator CheB
MIRVLIVDDSKTHRAAIRRLVEQAGEFEVVGVAENGEEGVELTHRLKPQIVLMDVNMPVLDGLAATERIMADKPTPILLMTAGENMRGEVDLSFRALELGALDLIPKPASIQPGEKEAQTLLTRLKLLAGVPVISHPRGRSRAAAKKPDSGRHPASSIIRRARWVVAVAASTGGPRALKTFIAGLPPDLHAGVVIVQHIDGAFLDGLVRWLSEERQGTVIAGEDGRGLHENEIVFAPNGSHMELTHDRRMVLVQGPPEGGHRPSGDRLLRSAALAYGPRAIGVVLTGMGEDGARGLLAIKEAGGQTFAQDEATSVVYGMPRAAAELGAAQQILPLGKLAEAVTRAIRS